MNRRDFNIQLTASIAALAALPLTRLAQAASTAGSPEAQHRATMMQLFNDLAGGDPAKIEAMLPSQPRHIAMLAYPGMFPLDFIAPHQVFTALMNTQVHIVGASREAIGGQGVSVTPTTLPKDCPKPLDVLFVPGGLEGTAAVMRDAALLGWLRERAATARYVTSVCTGSLVLGAAGLLQGRRAATYWAARELLPLLGAEPQAQRIVEDGRFITGGGVTAGMDFALLIAARLAGENYAKALQLYFEYAPAPPFDAGTPETAGKLVTDSMRTMYASGVETLRAAAVAARGAATPSG